jgi:UDP-N-acetylglucosamine 2-epimerase (non-hydrolysing)
MLLYLVAGARPNFMKIAPIVRALRADGRIAFKLVHTGQHSDPSMNDVFFDELGIPQPDVLLGAGGGTHAEQTARIMVGFEALCMAARPSAVLVVGDVNSTLACAIAAKKLGISVAHVEAGLRSGDMSMPEEINRLVTDSISDWFFVTEPAALDHLRREGKPPARVHYVGHVMVDNVLHQVAHLPRAVHGSVNSSNSGSNSGSNSNSNSGSAGSSAGSTIKAQYGAGRYGVVTLHRPSNVDVPATFARIAGALQDIARELPLVFPVHPRTRANMAAFGIDLGEHIVLTAPQGYMAFLDLWKDAALVLTDSGGLQEETTALGVPCITLRENTERPVTVDEGSNVLAGSDPAVILREAHKILAGNGKQGRRPHLWDGQAAGRIVDILARELA